MDIWILFALGLLLFRAAVKAKLSCVLDEALKSTEPISTRRVLARNYISALLSLPLSVCVATWNLSVKAIPESEAIKKLNVIPVFVVTDSRGVPLPIPQENQLVLPLYLERAEANRQLEALRRSNPSIRADIVAVPLDKMNEKVFELNGQLKDKSKPLVAPIVAYSGDRSIAESILREQGLSASQIKEGLNVPVFFTKPFLTIKTPSGAKGTFFMSYGDLQKALAKLPLDERRKLKPQTADLSAVLREIIKEPEDSFAIFPTPAYFSLIRENKNKQSNTEGSEYSIAVESPSSSIPPRKELLQNVPKADGRASLSTTRLVATIAKNITVRIEGPGPSGSGAILAKQGSAYTILTAWHVVSNVAKGESIRIVLDGGQSVTVQRDDIVRVGNTDLAYMNVRLPVEVDLSNLSKENSAKPGDKITVSGWSLETEDNPVLYRHLPGLVVSVSSSPSVEGYQIMYTMLSPTLQGMSGGPVIREDGVLIGIHGKAERLPTTDVEGTKNIATTNGQAMPILLLKSVR